MKTLMLSLCFGLAACGTSLAVGGEGERSATVDPTFWNTGNTFRITYTSPTAANPVLISSAPELAQVTGSSPAVSLGINIWRERYIVNMCTSAAMALTPTTSNYVFSYSSGIILSSAGVGTSIVTYSNSIRLYNQDNIFAVWDTGSIPAGIGPSPACQGGAVVMEQYYTPTTNPNRRR